jgi:hypothetical protein
MLAQGIDRKQSGSHQLGGSRPVGGSGTEEAGITCR